MSTKRKPPGAKMLDISPATVAFAPPSGKKQSADVTLRNASPFPVAFKISTNRPKFYAVRPNKGTVHMGASETIKVELKEGGGARADGASHEFQVMFMPWPKHIEDYDAKEWEKHEKNKVKIQTEIFCAEIKDESPSRDTSKKDKDESSSKSNKKQAIPSVRGGPTLIAVQPTKLAIKPKGECLTVSSRHSRTVAFKVQTHDGKYYVVNPNKGVLPPNAHKTEKIEIRMDKKLSVADLLDVPEAKQIFVLAFEWPSNAFDPDMWNNFRKTKPKEMQKVIVEVDLEAIALAAKEVPPTANYTPDVVAMSQHIQVKSFPAILCFGNASQVSPLNLLNMSAFPVGFKLEPGVPGMWDNYAAKPSMGVLQPAAMLQIALSIKNKSMTRELVNNADKHVFRIKLISWPAKVKQFSEQVWNEYFGHKGKSHSILVRVNNPLLHKPTDDDAADIEENHIVKAKSGKQGMEDAKQDKSPSSKSEKTPASIYLKNVTASGIQMAGKTMSKCTQNIKNRQPAAETITPPAKSPQPQMKPMGETKPLSKQVPKKGSQQTPKKPVKNKPESDCLTAYGSVATLPRPKSSNEPEPQTAYGDVIRPPTPKSKARPAPAPAPTRKDSDSKAKQTVKKPKVHPTMAPTVYDSAPRRPTGPKMAPTRYDSEEDKPTMAPTVYAQPQDKDEASERDPQMAPTAYGQDEEEQSERDPQMAPTAYGQDEEEQSERDPQMAPTSYDSGSEQGRPNMAATVYANDEQVSERDPPQMAPTVYDQRMASPCTSASSAHSSDNGPSEIEIMGPHLFNLNPKALSFNQPYGRKQSCRTRIENASDATIAFKVQTNKKNYYNVCPQRGILPPGASAHIAFELMDVFGEEEAAQANHSHRFQVMALAWPEDVGEFDGALWQRLESTKVDQLHTICFQASFNQ